MKFRFHFIVFGYIYYNLNGKHFVFVFFLLFFLYEKCKFKDVLLLLVLRDYIKIFIPRNADANHRLNVVILENTRMMFVYSERIMTEVWDRLFMAVSFVNLLDKVTQNESTHLNSSHGRKKSW